MGDQLKASIEVPQGVIDAHIQAAIMAALADGKKDQMVEAMIRAVMNMKVSRDYRDKPMFVDLFEQAVIAKVKSLLEEIVDKESDKIKELLRKQLKGTAMIEALSAAVLQGLGSSRWSVSIAFGARTRD